MLAKGKVVLELARWRQPREIVVLRSTVGQIGPDGEPLSIHPYPTPQLADDLWYFRRTFSPFRLALKEGELTFHGEGALLAGPAERRSLTEWARAVAAELAGEGSERSFGLVFSWHGGGGALPCDDVSVSLAGTVWAEACPWGGPVRARLDPSRLSQLYAWFDALAPFQAAPEEDAWDPERAPRLVFAGGGRRVATAAEKLEIEGFGLQLSRELRVRRPLPAGMAEAVPVAATHLLAPEVAGGGHPGALLLELPSLPPQPPARSWRGALRSAPEAPVPANPEPPAPEDPSARLP